MKPIAYMGHFDTDNIREAGVIVTRDKEDLNYQSRGKPDRIDELYTADQLRAAKVEVLREAASMWSVRGRISLEYEDVVRTDELRRMADEIEKGE